MDSVIVLKLHVSFKIGKMLSLNLKCMIFLNQKNF